MNTENRKIVLPLITKDSITNGSSSFKKIIGQLEAIKKLSFFVESHSIATPFPTTLFTGSQGLGKSYMAQKIADSLGRELVDVNCGSIKTAQDLIEGILIAKVAGENPKTILMDEAHDLSEEVTTSLLTILNPNNLNKNLISYKNWIIEYDFSRINMVFATTDAYRMFRPLVNRCEEIYFHTYSNEELFRILCFYLPDINISCNKEDIAYACRGRARDAFSLSQKIKRYVNKEQINDFDDNGWEEVKDIFGINVYGLKNEEVYLMRLIEEAKQISSTNLAVKMGVNVQNIESEIEIRPRELGFIENGTRGRILTEKGKEYLRGLK